MSFIYCVRHIIGPANRIRNSNIRVQRHISVAMQDIDIKLQQLFEQQQILQQHYYSGNRKLNKHCIIPLPELEILIFDGNKINWREFLDIFQTTIDQNNLIWKKLVISKG